METSTFPSIIMKPMTTSYLVEAVSISSIINHWKIHISFVKSKPTSKSRLVKAMFISSIINHWKIYISLNTWKVQANNYITSYKGYVHFFHYQPLRNPHFLREKSKLTSTSHLVEAEAMSISSIINHWEIHISFDTCKVQVANYVISCRGYVHFFQYQPLKNPHFLQHL